MPAPARTTPTAPQRHFLEELARGRDGFGTRHDVIARCEANGWITTHLERAPLYRLTEAGVDAIGRERAAELAPPTPEPPTRQQLDDALGDVVIIGQRLRTDCLHLVTDDPGLRASVVTAALTLRRVARLLGLDRDLDAEEADHAEDAHDCECPTCTSGDPHLHPAPGADGEPQLCPDPFHALETRENTRARIGDLAVDLTGRYPDRRGWWTPGPASPGAVLVPGTAVRHGLAAPVPLNQLGDHDHGVVALLAAADEDPPAHEKPGTRTRIMWANGHRDWVHTEDLVIPDVTRTGEPT